MPDSIQLMPDPAIIKSTVCSNFDQSAEAYDTYEKKRQHFSHLARHLLDFTKIKPGMTVVDVGCGTGISTFAIAMKVGPGGRVIGVDLSEGMLKKARTKCHEGGWGPEKKDALAGTIEFMKGDAEMLSECLIGVTGNGGVGEGMDVRTGNGGVGESRDMRNGNGGVDAVLFNATIFLVPDAQRALREACSVLREGGVVGMNYPFGLYGNGTWREKPPLFEKARDEGLGDAPYGSGIVDVERLPDMLGEAGFVEIHTWKVEVILTREEAEGFYAIPAQSAGLYPRTPYAERLEKLRSVLDHFMDKGVEDFVQKWHFIRASK